MKHSTMFKMLTGVAIAALISTTFAAVNVPYTSNFETYAEGYDIGTNSATTGWYAEEEVAIAATDDNPTGYYAGAPLPADTHNVTMKFDGTVSNSIAGIENENVYVDFLVQPTFWDEDDNPAVPENSQLAMFFDTNGYANVYHGYQSLDASVSTTLWTRIDSVDAISTGDWVRVTYQMDYTAPAGYTFFHLYINGHLVTNNFAYPDNWPEEEPTATNGTYFLIADSLLGDIDPRISSFTAKGAGTLDDFVVTDESIAPFVPDTPSTQWTVDVTANEGGTASPSGATLVDEGDSFSTTITADSGYQISEITTNSISISITNTAVQVVTIDSVMADVDIEASFTLGAIPATNGVEVSSQWLMDYGLALDETSADMYWEAYVADINPTNGSKFEIIDAGVIDGTNYIKWVSEGKTPTLPAFSVYGTDDLTEGWYYIGSQPRPSSYTTNVFMDATRTYYKVHAIDELEEY